MQNAELLTLTYGSLIVQVISSCCVYSSFDFCFYLQLIKDFEQVSMINEQLEKMGHNIGT
jgi:hypothetical protein